MLILLMVATSNFCLSFAMGYLLAKVKSFAGSQWASTEITGIPCQQSKEYVISKYFPKSKLKFKNIILCKKDI